MNKLDSKSFIERVRDTEIPFKSNVIERFSIHDLHKDFVIEEHSTDNDSILVDDIAGTDHDSYVGLTWEEMLHKGERMYTNLPLVENNPQYYYTIGRKDNKINFAKFNGKYYVIGAGNHRSAIAKFLFFFSGHRYLHSVHVDEYKMDARGFDAIESITECIEEKGLKNLSVKKWREIVREESGVDWKKNYFQTVVQIKNHTSNEIILIKDLLDPQSFHSLKRLHYAIKKRSKFSRWFSTNPYAKFVG